MYARMRAITPARPQFETRPLLLDVIEVPRPVNKTGLYSREASIRGNTAYDYFFLSYSTRHCDLDLLFLVSFHTNIHTQTHKRHFDFHSTAVISCWRFSPIALILHGEMSNM